jgi:clostripain
MGADGTAYAFTPGSATVTATSVKDATKLATATVTVTEKPLTFGAWTDGEFRADPYSSSYYVWYSFPAVAGTSYKVEWNDSANGDSTKTLNVSATCYHQDKNYTYFAYTDSGYGPNAKIFTATTTETAFIRIGRSSTSNTGTFSLRVEAMDPVDSVSIPATASLDSGASLQLVATVLPATANQGVTWTTSDLAVASVSSGTVLGKKPGTASITVKSSTDPTKTASCVVTVSAASLPLNGSWTGITASSTYDTWYSVPITAGKCYEFMVDDYRSSPGTYPAWLKKEAYRGDTTTPYFSSTLAMFETSSRFVVPAAGETVIYFRLTYYITSGAARVAVKEWDLPASVAISGPSTISAPGDTAQLSASVLPATAPQRVTWTSQASGIMSVGATTGLVTAEAYGGATIQATSSADPALTATHDVVLAEPAKKSAWTVMYYSDADCDLEAALMSDIAEMKAGLREDADINVILLVDRHPSSSSPYSSDAVTLGTNFSDTRLFRILPGSFMRLNGSTQFPEITTTSTYEANMGDANTLRKFIDFCKANYPATNYALFVSNHGAGSRSNPSDDSRSSIKGVCFDETSSNDCLYTAELTDVLDSTHSVDLFAFDACFMGTAEVAYQYRPGTGDFSADYMVASGPTVWGAGFPYTKILERLRTGGGNNGTVDSTVGGLEAYLDPATMTAAQFGALIVEEQYDDTSANPTYGNGQELGVFDLSAMATLKTLVDEFAVLLWSENEKVDFEAIRGSYSTTYPIDYFAQSNEIEWLAYPYFDLYSLVGLVSTSANFSTAVKAKAEEIKTAVDAVVLYSFGNSDYSGFVPGKHGLSIFFPDGDRSYSSNPMWGYQWWYSPIDTNAWWTGGHYYGKLAWCADGRNATASAVGNWFELLDSWFDTSNTATGGVNGVQW